jgi:diguanylate cyclase (GGDEF)-like protein
MSYKNLFKRILFSRLIFLKSSIPQVIVWPVLCIIMVTVLWYWTDARIEADRHTLEKQALDEATKLGKDYEIYLAQIIEQVNQITLQVQFNYEQSHGKLNLKELSESGMFRSPQVINVLIVNREGLPVTGIVPYNKNVFYTDRDFFVFHKNDKSMALQIGKPIMGRVTGKPIITFTRRLNTPQGSFDGIIVAAIDPTYLTAFFAGSFPGKSGLLALAGLDGILRSITIGSDPQNSTLPALRTVPLFASPEGAQYQNDEQWSGDQQARFVAWKTLKEYPLVALVGISEQDFFASHHESWSTYKSGAVVGSIFLFLFAFVATVMSARLALKKHQEHEQRKAYRLATEGGNDGFFMYEALHDKSGAIIDFILVDCNARGAEFYGVDSNQLLQTKLSSFYPAVYFNELLNTFRSAMESGFYEDVVKVPRESLLQIEWVKRRLVRSGNGLAVTVQDISERKLAEEKIEFMAHHDPLTHLPNRVLLRDRSEQAIAAATREKTGVVILFLDLDNFKNINDGCGHLVGDQLLIQVVTRLKDCIRDADTLCRQGGDEFIILLTQIEGINEISRIAQKILDTISEPFEIENQKLHTSASIGIAVFPSDGDDLDSLLKNADTAMYQAKESGKNAYRFFTDKMNIDAMGRLRLHTQLSDALKRKEFQLHYQPQIDLLSGNVIGMEALIRWYHPEQGIISPAQFIPVAEASGLIIPIGEWVLEEACRQACIWQQNGQPPFKVAVNLSALQFKRGNILETVSKVLERSGIPSSMIELELTESILLQDMGSALQTIKDLKSIGVQLSIDDFGTGYSSLSYLKQLKVDKLKIDQSFVRELINDNDDKAIVTAIIQLGHNLQMQVTAEGVETAEQLAFLRTHGCDEAQGYLFSRPLAPADFDVWLTARNQSIEIM